MASSKKNSAAFVMPAKSSNSRKLAGAHFAKGGTTKVAGVMKIGGAAKSVKPAKKYERGGTGPGKGLFEQIKSTQEAIKKMPTGSAQEQKDYQDMIRIRNGEALENGINRSIILNPKGYKRVLELEDKINQNDKRFTPASKKIGGKVGKAKPTMKRGGGMKKGC